VQLAGVNPFFTTRRQKIHVKDSEFPARKTHKKLEKPSNLLSVSMEVDRRSHTMVHGIRFSLRSPGELAVVCFSQPARIIGASKMEELRCRLDRRLSVLGHYDVSTLAMSRVRCETSINGAMPIG